MNPNDYHFSTTQTWHAENILPEGWEMKRTEDDFMFIKGNLVARLDSDGNVEYLRNGEPFHYVGLPDETTWGALADILRLGSTLPSDTDVLRWAQLEETRIEWEKEEEVKCKGNTELADKLLERLVRMVGTWSMNFVHKENFPALTILAKIMNGGSYTPKDTEPKSHLEIRKMTADFIEEYKRQPHSQVELIEYLESRGARRSASTVSEALQGFPVQIKGKQGRSKE